MAADATEEDKRWFQAHERRWGRGSDRMLGVHASPPAPLVNFTALARTQFGSPDAQ